MSIWLEAREPALGHKHQHTAQQPAQRKEIKKQQMITNITYKGDEREPEMEH
jgi:hypothetical protein